MELWFTEEVTDNVRFSMKVDKQLYSGQSQIQRIDVFETVEFGWLLALDGWNMCTEKDEFIYHDMIVHVPMAVRPGTRKVLVIGGGGRRHRKGADPLRHHRAHRPGGDRRDGGRRLPGIPAVHVLPAG